MIVLVHAGVCDSRMWEGFDLPGGHDLRDARLRRDADAASGLLLPRGRPRGGDRRRAPCRSWGRPTAAWSASSWPPAGPSSSASWCCSTPPCPTTPGRRRSRPTASARSSSWTRGDLRGGGRARPPTSGSPIPRRASGVVEMQQRAYELQVDAVAEEIEPDVHPAAPRCAPARWWWSASTTSRTSTRSPIAWWREIPGRPRGRDRGRRAPARARAARPRRPGSCATSSPSPKSGALGVVRGFPPCEPRSEDLARP